MSENERPSPLVTHVLMERAGLKLVVSGPYVNETDEWGNVCPWRIVADAQDETGRKIETILHRTEFADEAEAWCDGWAARDKLAEENVEQLMEAFGVSTKAPF